MAIVSALKEKTEKHNEILHKSKLKKAKSEVCRRSRYDPKDEHLRTRNINL